MPHADQAEGVEASQLPEGRPPELWSREEAMLRTCSWGGLVQGPWQSNEQGGTDFVRWPRRYQADRGAERGVQCTKHQKSNMCLLPGVMLYWCMDCRRCLFFHVMDNAESPRLAPQAATANCQHWQAVCSIPSAVLPAQDGG